MKNNKSIILKINVSRETLIHKKCGKMDLK